MDFALEVERPREAGDLFFRPSNGEIGEIVGAFERQGDPFRPDQFEEVGEPFLPEQERSEGKGTWAVPFVLDLPDVVGR